MDEDFAVVCLVDHDADEGRQVAEGFVRVCRSVGIRRKLFSVREIKDGFWASAVTLYVLRFVVDDTAAPSLDVRIQIHCAGVAVLN